MYSNHDRSTTKNLARFTLFVVIGMFVAWCATVLVLLFMYGVAIAI